MGQECVYVLQTEWYYVSVSGHASVTSCSKTDRNAKIVLDIVRIAKIAAVFCITEYSKESRLDTGSDLVQDCPSEWRDATFR